MSLFPKTTIKLQGFHVVPTVPLILPVCLFKSQHTRLQFLRIDLQPVPHLAPRGLVSSLILGVICTERSQKICYTPRREPALQRTDMTTFEYIHTTLTNMR